MIQKLSQEVVNQIAAGEVIERPASVIKELLDNAIDANSNRIEIKIKNGGRSYIEVSDNGTGVQKSDLEKVFEAHTTSKIQNLEDLNEILSMGFRGEALSTIVSVASVSMISKAQDAEFAYKIEGKGVTITSPQKSPRDVGTTVIVENLFEKIPARLKYLRAESTEYRKILEILIPYFLAYPNIHFIFSHNNKQIHNLPKVKELDTRVSNVLKGDFTKNMLHLFFNGEGMKITGYIARPEHNFNKTIHQYIFINNRPISDKGIVRAVSEGFSRFIPEGKKVPFIINIEMKSSLVDINVHPRKEEVRFINPFRVYTAVEESVKQALKDYSNKETSIDASEAFRDKPREINYKNKASHNIGSGLKFSEQLLKNNKVEKHRVDSFSSKDLFTTEQTDNEQLYYYQIFNMYIVVQLEKEIWIIDQHAASERIFYEKIDKQFHDNSVEAQNLLIPLDFELSDVEILFLEENKEIFKDFGFDFEIKNNITKISKVPSMLVSTDFGKFFKDLISESETEKNIEKLKGDFISVIACHASVRAGQHLSPEEMKEILSQLKKCENSTTCPHGRPIIWKISKKELDKKFQRT